MSVPPGAPRLAPLEPPVSPVPVGAEPPAAAPAPSPAPVLRAAPEPPAAPPAPQVTLEAQLLRFRLVAPDQMSEAMRIEAETGKAVAETVVERGWVSADDLQKVLESLAPAVPAPPAPPLTPAPASAPATPPAPAPLVVAPPAPPPVAPAPEPAPVAVAPEPAPQPEPEPVAAAREPAPQPEPEPELPPAAVERAPEPEPTPPPPAAEPPAARAPKDPPAAAGTARVVVRLRSGEELDAGAYPDAATARAHAKELVAELQAEDAWPFVAGRSVAPEEIEKIFLEKRSQDG